MEIGFEDMEIVFGDRRNGFGDMEIGFEDVYNGYTCRMTDKMDSSSYRNKFPHYHSMRRMLVVWLKCWSHHSLIW
jgi:hypothetical protein